MTFREVIGRPSSNVDLHEHGADEISGDFGGTVRGVDVLALPRGVLGYTQVTSNQSTITTETALTGLTVDVTVAAGRKIEVTAQAQVQSITSASDGTIRIKEDTDVLNRIDHEHVNAAVRHTYRGSVILEPDEGTHTYFLTLAGTGDGVTMLAVASQPAFILVTDLGAA